MDFRLDWVRAGEPLDAEFREVGFGMAASAVIDRVGPQGMLAMSFSAQWNASATSACGK
jgi:hypothetical protein